MALFPANFVEDLKHQADIVVVIQDYVTLKKTGATYKGLCPFHGEKTPSFHVNRDRGFFHCFGCGAGGDVIKFLELHEKVSFVDAIKLLAQRFGIALPEPEQTTDEQRAHAADREGLLKIHEVAAAWFRQQLQAPSGARIRQQLDERRITQATSEILGLGFAPQGRESLTQALSSAGFSTGLQVRAGLVFQRDDGSVVDRFRNRLMIPIARDTGSVIAFGGRAVEDGQQPKYLNSPETPIYTKSRTLYGLNLSKAAIRQGGFAVLVEGYFDFAQVYQSGFQAVVASCGTALTPQQAQYLRRFCGKVVLNFDPDAAGQGAAAKSCEMLVSEGFEVNVVSLPDGSDPDTFVRRQGGQAYLGQLKRSQPYLEYLLSEIARRHDLNAPEGRAQFVDEALPIVNRIPDRTRQEIFVKEVAARAGVSEGAVWPRITKVVTYRSAGPSSSQLPALGQVTKAEKALIWWLVHRPDEVGTTLVSLATEDLAGLAARSVLDLARQLNEDREFSPSLLLERLSDRDSQLVTGVATEPEAPALDLDWCVRELRRARYERERAEVQRAVEQLQRGGEGHSPAMDELLTRKGELGRLIQALAED
ncbi:MAG: DNA primase [Vicinamibacterales bacterium]